MSGKDSEFDKFTNELVENIKTSEQIIDKGLLKMLIEDTEGLLGNISANPYKFENWHIMVIKNNLRALKLINQRLGYE